MSKANLPTPLARFVAGRLGTAVRVAELGRPRGNATVHLWEGCWGRGVIKAYRSARTYRQELRAYREWLPALDHVPRLLAAHERRPFALLLEHLPGIPLVDAQPGPAAEREAHRRAGRWLRTLHALPFTDADAVSLEEGYRRRLLALGERLARDQMAGSGSAATGVETALLNWLGAAFDRVLPLFAGAGRTPCHRDWEPRNWLVDPNARWLAAIDFEHARPDHPLADLSRLAAYVWPARPELKAAFLDGYSRNGGSADLALVELFAALDAVQRLAWARSHGDRKLRWSAWSALNALGAPVDGHGAR